MSYFATPNTWCWNYGVEDKHVGQNRAAEAGPGATMPYGQGARAGADAQVADVTTAAPARPVGGTALLTDDTT